MRADVDLAEMEKAQPLGEHRLAIDAVSGYIHFRVSIVPESSILSYLLNSRNLIIRCSLYRDRLKLFS